MRSLIIFNGPTLVRSYIIQIVKLQHKERVAEALAYLVQLQLYIEQYDPHSTIACNHVAIHYDSANYGTLPTTLWSPVTMLLVYEYYVHNLMFRVLEVHYFLPCSAQYTYKASLVLMHCAKTWPS